MPLSPMPPADNAGAVPQGDDQRDHFAEFLNKNSYIPVWLHPDVAHGILQHFGREGTAIVHPHPESRGRDNYATGGVAAPSPLANPAVAAGATAGGGAPIAGIQSPAVVTGGRQSIFGGGQIGASGPTARTPVFAQGGGMMDGRGGTGKVPGVDLGKDSVHAMLQPGEAVFNKKQLAGIKPRMGKEHLLRPDQKKAMRNASSK